MVLVDSSPRCKYVYVIMQKMPGYVNPAEIHLSPRPRIV